MDKNQSFNGAIDIIYRSTLVTGSLVGSNITAS
jgi:hypothetical protein